MSKNKIETQITLPPDLYQAIAQRAELNGQSFSNEIASLLTPLFSKISQQLEQEFQDWESASDEDWLSLEENLSLEQR